MKWPSIAIEQGGNVVSIDANVAPSWALSKAINSPDFDRTEDGLTPQRQAVCARILQERCQ